MHARDFLIEFSNSIWTLDDDPTIRVNHLSLKCIDSAKPLKHFIEVKLNKTIVLICDLSKLLFEPVHTKRHSNLCYVMLGPFKIIGQ